MDANAKRAKEILINFIVPIICLSVVGLTFLIVIYPTIKNKAALDAELKSVTSTRDILSDKLARLHRFVDFKSVLEENSNLVNQVLPDEEFVPGLLDQVNRLSDESGLQLSKLSYSVSDNALEETVDGAPTYSSVAVSVGAEGSYGQMIAFMESMEKASRIVSVSTFRFSSTERESATRSMTFVLNAPYLSANSNANTDEPLKLDLSNSDFISLINKLKNLRHFEQSSEPLDLPVEAVEESSIDEDLVNESSDSASGSTEQPGSGGGL